MESEEERRRGMKRRMGEGRGWITGKAKFVAGRNWKEKCIEKRQREHKSRGQRTRGVTPSPSCHGHALSGFYPLLGRGAARGRTGLLHSL